MTGIVMIALSLYETLVLWNGWTWFAVPLGAPDVGYWACFALATMLTTATNPMGSVRRWHTHGGGIDSDVVVDCAKEYAVGLLMVHGVLAVIRCLS